MVKRGFVRALLALLFICVPAIGNSSADDLEKDLGRNLRESKTIVVQATAKLRAGEIPTPEIAHLKSIADNVRASHLLMQERFRLREGKAAVQGGKAVDRQNTVATAYTRAIDDYLALIDALPPDSTVTQSTLDSLKSLLDKIIPTKKRPIIGALPYKHPNYPPREPATTPVVVPAYRGGNRSVSPSDTAASAEAPINKEIADLAQLLQWNPVLIYEWVKNNVETEWYWGVMKGAEETLHQKSGNDADQAALLVALLRASGYPSRFVKGTIEFFPDIDKVKNLTGLTDPMQIAAFFQRAGIAFKPVIAGGGIANFQVEHIWVESQIPYANYRGAVIDDQGKTWLGLDTSIKPLGYTRNTPLDIPADVTASVRNDYLAANQEKTPLEFLQGKVKEYLDVNQPGKAWQDALSTRTINPDVLNIVPASLQFKVIAVTGEYTELPAELRHQVKFTAKADSKEIFTITLDSLKLSNKSITLTYEPETVEDQQIIDSYGGLDNTPSYLVRLRPVLTVDGERLIVAGDGLPMGAEYTLVVDVATPSGTETITSAQIAGNLTAIGIVGGKAAALSPVAGSDNAETLLRKEAISYIDRWNRAEDELAAFYKVALIRPVPAFVIVGGLIDVTSILDTPHDFQWKGVFIDAVLRGIEVVGNAAGEQGFMRLSSLQGSILENRIFEDDFKVESISTAKLLHLARVDGTPLVAIDRTNVTDVLPTLPFDDNVKTDIANAVNQGMTVTIPRAEIGYQDWRGIGYVKENPETGEAGWMLTGMVAGGMTAAKAWVNSFLQETLGNPNTKSNKDKLSAASIMKIPVTDMQKGTVGTEVKEKLAVLVIDVKGRPVEGASVTFSVIAGGGSIKGAQTVTTGRKGIAAVDYTLGQKTSENAIYFQLDPQDEKLTQVGLNLVTASVESRDKPISIKQPFEAYGIPGDPVTIIKQFGDGTTNLANNPAGSLMVKVVDAYSNPVSNVTIQYESLPAASKDTAFTLPPNTRNIQFYRPQVCTDAYPLYGDCPTFGAAQQKTGFDGCFVNAILGNTVNTQYTVKVFSPSHPQLAPVTFTLASEGSRKDGEYLPSVLLIRYLDYYNSSGQRVNSTRVGTSLKKPLTSDLFMLIDDYIMAGPKTCVKTVLGIDTTYDCWQIVPSGLTKVQRIPDGTVTYSVTAGGGKAGPTINMTGGKYQAGFTAGPLPEINTIVAVGNATVTIPEVLLNPDTGKAILDGYPVATIKLRDIPMQSSKQVLFNKTTKEPVFGDTEMLTNYLVYGVDVKLSMKPSVIHITKDGYAKRDTAFTYTILPAEYNCMISDLDFISKDEANIEAWAGSIPGDKTQGQGTSTMLAGSPWDIRKQYFAQVVLNNGSEIEIRGDKVSVPIGLGALVPDYNHDRKIDDIDRNRAELDDTYYFWVNDDDGKGDTEGTGIPGTRTFPLLNKIPGTRDLVDWFPVHLDIKDLFDAYPPSVYGYFLSTDTPSLRYVQTNLGPGTSGTYLTDVQNANDLIANQQIKAVAANPATPIDPLLIQAIKDGNGLILLESVLPTSSPLKLQIRDQAGAQRYEMSLPLSIAGVEQMFRHKNLSSVVKGGNGPSPAHGSISGGEPDRFVSNEEPKNFPDAECNKDVNFVFLHGYNVNGQQARGWQAEMFKRLYWSRSKARFWAITWYGAETQKLALNLFTPDYHINVINAFETAPALKDFLNANVIGDITIAAHSLGNMVVSSMLSENHGGWDDNYFSANPAARIKHYFLIDAAISKEAFGDTTKDETFTDNNNAQQVNCDGICMDHPQWKGYEERLFASEWYDLFKIDQPLDYRSKLTWRDIFVNRPLKTSYYNFYSPGEEVLSGLKGIPLDLNLVISEFKELGKFTWTLQEKLKGRLWLDPGIDVLGSSYGGWGFNLDDYGEYNAGTDKIEPKSTVFINDVELNPPEQFRTKPLFKKGAGTELFAENGGSSYAQNYSNKISLLAHAIPARTLPVGANRVSVFDSSGGNFDMQAEFKNDLKDWPINRLPLNNWRHSDVREVAYPYIYKLFDQITEIGGLK